MSLARVTKNAPAAAIRFIREKFTYTQARIDEANARIDNIPAGPQGEPGPSGSDGQPGADGPPGEVSLQQFNDSIAGTARNPFGSAPYPGMFSDPVTQAEMLAYVAWNEARWQSIMRQPT